MDINQLKKELAKLPKNFNMFVGKQGVGKFDTTAYFSNQNLVTFWDEINKQNGINFTKGEN